MKNLFKAIAFITFGLTLGCSQHSTGRYIASLDRVPAQADVIENDLLKSSQNVLALLKTPELPLSACHNEMKETFDFLSSVPSNYFETNYSSEQYREILENLWAIKKNLRRHNQIWSDKEVIDRECVKSLKAALRATRYIEDHAGLVFINKNGGHVTGLNDEDKSDIFSKGYPWIQTDRENKEFNFREELKTGDILMWRGTTSISASIARLGDSKNNFSHVSIIYKDPKSKKIYNVESLIETGVTMQEFSQSELHAGSAKVVVFRHKNSELAKIAGEFAFKHASSTIGTSAHRLYDFNFDLQDHSTIFCSELISWAYDHASQGLVQIPQFLTKFDMKNRKFLNDLGTDAKEGFQPGDIELEPNFTMVAEWRNFHYSRVNHLKDIILTNMYAWMDEHGYQFKWNLKGNALGQILYTMRRMPGLGKIAEDKLPINMPRKTLTNVITMDKVSTGIYKTLKRSFYKDNPMRFFSLASINATLEDFRVRDLEKYKDQIRANKNGQAAADSAFHNDFGPLKRDVKL